MSSTKTSAVGMTTALYTQQRNSLRLASVGTSQRRCQAPRHRSPAYTSQKVKQRVQVLSPYFRAKLQSHVLLPCKCLLGLYALHNNAGLLTSYGSISFISAILVDAV